MTNKKVAVLSGDGIGPEVTLAALAVCQAALGEQSVEWIETPFGNQAYLEQGSAFPEESVQLCDEADAVLLGAVGGPEELPPDVPRPEMGLLTLRRQLDVYANLRPVRPHPVLFDTSPLRPERLEGVDILFVRELTGGIYFGAKERTKNSATDTCVYTVSEVERIVRKACQLAMDRRKKVTSVDKKNVLETSRLWSDVTERVVRDEFPEIELESLLVDAMAMHLLSRAQDFDVVVTENMFGDILTDEASMLVGSMGMLPSASLGDGTRGLYEPIHGSAPDIAGKGIANPYAAILSGAMLLRLSLGMEAAASRIEEAIEQAINDGIRTPDLGGSETTSSATDAVIARLN